MPCPATLHPPAAVPDRSWCHFQRSTSRAHICLSLRASLPEGFSQMPQFTRLNWRKLMPLGTDESQWMRSSASLCPSGSIVKCIFYRTSQGPWWVLVLAAHSVSWHTLCPYSTFFVSPPAPLHGLPRFISKKMPFK